MQEAVGAEQRLVSHETPEAVLKSASGVEFPLNFERKPEKMISGTVSPLEDIAQPRAEIHEMPETTGFEDVEDVSEFERPKTDVGAVKPKPWLRNPA